MLSSFDYAVIRVVPRVEREEFLNAGVILFCRTRRFLAAKTTLDRVRLAAFASDLDPIQVETHLTQITRLSVGGPAAGPLGGEPAAARFHWLVSPRSTVIQVSAVHSGLCSDPGEALNRLFDSLVGLPVLQTRAADGDAHARQE